MRTTKGWDKTRLAGMFAIVLAMVPVLDACGQSVSGRYTGESDRSFGRNGGLMAFEFDGGIVKVTSINNTVFRKDEPQAAPYKVSGKHITIGSSFVLEIKDDNTLEGLGSPIDGKRFLKSVGDFDYTETSEGGRRGITITNYAGTKPVVTIPAKIRNLPVTAIGEHSFALKQLTGVTIPEGVTTIEYNAFGNNQLTSVTIPNSVTTIGYGAFANNRLAGITIRESVTTIADHAFDDNQLTNITIPNSVTTIGTKAFDKNQLTNITIGKNVDIGDITGNRPLQIDLGAFNEDFTRYYNDHNEKRAGTYTLVNGQWSAVYR
jgi:hypothetical protein